MKDKFDDKLELNAGNLPYGMHGALVEVADTLSFAVTIAETRLGKNWSGADAIAICRLVLERREQIIKPIEDETLKD